MCDIDLGESDHCIFKMIERYRNKYGLYALRDFIVQNLVSNLLDISMFTQYGINAKYFVSLFLTT